VWRFALGKLGKAYFRKAKAPNNDAPIVGRGLAPAVIFAFRALDNRPYGNRNSYEMEFMMGLRVKPALEL